MFLACSSLLRPLSQNKDKKYGFWCRYQGVEFVHGSTEIREVEGRVALTPGGKGSGGDTWWKGCRGGTLSHSLVQEERGTMKDPSSFPGSLPDYADMFQLQNSFIVTFIFIRECFTWTKKKVTRQKIKLH